MWEFLPEDYPVKHIADIFSGMKFLSCLSTISVFRKLPNLPYSTAIEDWDRLENMPAKMVTKEQCSPGKAAPLGKKKPKLFILIHNRESGDRITAGTKDIFPLILLIAYGNIGR